tara:strand:+ start:1250 stop:1432 length:183 start_codon:yes stop_codon:yes gene_type:complete
MKRKMMTKEIVPDNSTTNGGNGAYMRRKIMQDKTGPDHGKKVVREHITGVAPAVKRWMTK